MNQKESEKVVRVMIIGDSSVGKTSIMSKYINDYFQPNQLTTIGIDYRNKKIRKQNVNLKLQIWDTAGDERYHTLTNVSIKDADALVMTYDITNLKSFESIQDKWIPLAQARCKTSIIALVGTKLDLDKEREVSIEKADQLAKFHKFLFFETSAKDDINVSNLFDVLTDSFIEYGERIRRESLLKDVVLEKEADPEQACNCGLSKLWC